MAKRTTGARRAPWWAVALLAALCAGAAWAADSDGDGLADDVDRCPYLAGAGAQDTDGDGVGDGCDNCAALANADQRDADADGFGSRCDADLNNDGRTGFADLSAWRAAYGGSDGAADLDGSGQVDGADLDLLSGLVFAPPGPSGLVADPRQPPPANQPPQVEAGPALTLTLDGTRNSLPLAARVLDDYLPSGRTLRLQWSASGPAPVTVTPADGPAPTARFSQSGQYTLTLTADDGVAQGSDAVVVTVAPAVPGQFIYHIGNSITDSIRYSGLQKLAESRGRSHTWGRHMIPGAPLEWTWNHPSEGFSEPPYGYYPNALPNYAWQTVVLQPFDRPLASDLDYAGRFFDLALQGNPDVQLYVYAFYPRRNYSSYPDPRNWGDDWEGQWLAGTTVNTSRAYFEALADGLTASHPQARPVRIVPTGEVFYHLYRKIQRGEVPGIDSIWDFYADDVHMNPTGSYVLATTYFATLYHESPVGLPVPAEYGSIDPALARVIQETVWEVVPDYPRAGVP